MAFDPDKLAKVKSDRSGGFDPDKLAALKADPSMLSQLGALAGKAGNVALQAFGAPDQLAGEAIRTAADGLPMRLPSIVGPDIAGPINNQYVSNAQPPASFVGTIASGLQGLNQGAVAGLQGQNPLPAAAAEIARPKNTLGDAALQTGLALAGGEVTNAPFNAASKAIGAVAPAIGKGIAFLSGGATNVKPRDYEQLFKNPGAIIPGTLDKAGAAYEAEAAKYGAGIGTAPTADKIASQTDPKKFAFNLYARLAPDAPPGSPPVSTKEALFGRQAIDAIYPTPNPKNGTYRAMLDKIRDTFQTVIAKDPAMAKVSNDYSVAKSGAAFLSPVPLTQSGKPGLFRTGAMAELARRGDFTAALSGSPVVAGLATAGAGITAQALQALAKSNPLKAALLSAYLNKGNQQ